MMNNKYFLNNELFFTQNDINQYENNKECLENYSSNVIFVIKMCKKFNIKNIDFLACNSLEYDNWKIYYDLLKQFSTTVIGASNDLTGNIKYGRDFVMENTNEDIQNIYFNENITSYSSTLFSSSISYYQNVLSYGRSAFLFIIQTTNNFDNLVLTNFTNLNFYNATQEQKIYNVYYREKNIGTFVLASNVNNLNINLLPNKQYEIILIFTNINTSGTSYYVSGPSTNTVTTVLASTNELIMYSSKSSNFIISTFNPNDSTTYVNLNNSTTITNQLLTLNYTFESTPTITLENAVNDVLTFVYGEYPPNLNAAIQSNQTETPVNITANITDGSASFNGGVLTINKSGSFTVTASQNGTNNYVSGSKTFTINILLNSTTNYANIKSLIELKYFMRLPDKPKYYKMSKVNLDNILSQSIQFKLEN